MLIKWWFERAPSAGYIEGAEPMRRETGFFAEENVDKTKVL